jgi:hypothetical protein
VSAVAVGLNEGGAAWVSQLARSRWFAGLGLSANDLQAAEAGSAGGSWELADTNPALPPLAPLITLAIDDPASVNVVEATSLVRTLGRLGRVLVTMPGSDHTTNLAESIRAMGAFVVRGGPETPLNHLHHFPLRAAIMARHGQLAGVDLADILSACRPGGAATLLTCSGLDEAAAILSRTPVNALIGHWHVPPADWDLYRFDQCFGAEPRPRVYTTTDRLDEESGTVDLLVPEGR